jgi:hypothetical protein
MLNTSCASELHSTSLRCRLGFHRWVEARNDMDEPVFMCLRCGHLSTWDDSNIPLSAFSYFAGAIRGPLG